MTLTREEILNQPPGRKLDRWIQEHIFKWIPWAEQRGDYLVVTFQKPGEREPYKGSQNWKSQMDRYSVIQYSDIDPIKHAVYRDEDWSTDISVAWEVFVQFDLPSVGMYVDQDDNEWFTCNIGTHRATGKTGPEAICKCALLATLGL